MRRLVSGILGLVLCGAHFAASATFHVVEVIEVFSTPDGSVQYIEFICLSDGQDQMNTHQMSSAENVYTFTANLPDFATFNHHFVVATQSYTYLPGAITPDYIMPRQFFDVTADTLNIVLGAKPAFTFTSGMLPMNGVLSLNRDSAAPTVYSSSLNSPQNFAGEVGSIDASGIDANNVYANLDAAEAGKGTQASPFPSMTAALSLANASATIHIAPSASAETFTGAQAIAQPLSLINSNPAGGLVRIGVIGARNNSIAPPRTGFIAGGVAK